jgi:hypothetical protein
MWAKASGNFEFTEGGWPSEAMRFLTGAPTYTYDLEDLTSDEIWSYISDSDEEDMIITAATECIESDSSVNAVGLALSHAYSVLGVYKVYNADGTLKADLIKMRNPWGSDGSYNGTWSDSDTIWNTDGETYST